MKLSDLKPGESGVIIKILGHGAFRKRVMEIGYVKGRVVKMILNAPLMDPIKFSLMGYEVSLRKSEASMIEIVPLEEWQAMEHHDLEKEKPKIHSELKNGSQSVRDDKIINVALIGNPNCGKTSLFNIVSGAHEHVGNYAGVTVDAKQGSLNYKGYRFNVVDLPGTYSLSAYSPEEKYVMRYLKKETPDVIVNVVVASNLERNLYMTTELIDMNRSMVIALNMYDELEKSGVEFDYDTMGRMIGVPIVPTVASTGRGVQDLLDTIIRVYEMQHEATRHIHIPLRPELEEIVKKLNDEIKQGDDVLPHFSPRFQALKLLEHDVEIETMMVNSPNFDKLIQLRNQLDEQFRKVTGEDPQTAIAADKYGFIQGALAEMMKGDIIQEEKTTKIIDAIVTSKIFGFPLFLIIMFITFWATFQIGSYPMEWIESGVNWLSSILEGIMSDGPLKDLILDGIIGGVGGVIVFLPNILILYAFISLMEDSGYMARVAFIMDKIMHRMGLHGKSFIPLVMGFGCNVPAIMSTRIIESHSSRLITILINPFISCSARIPIYVLLVGAFFPKSGSLVFMGLYLLGIVVAVLTARLMRRFWLKEDETPFVMELPPYRTPTMKATLRNMWAKASQYLKKMGGLILVASIIIWALSYFPRYTIDQVPESFIQSTVSELPAETIAESSEDQISELVLSSYQEEHSCLGYIGKFCEPVVRPMEFGWKTTVALIAGASAKEIVVSTLGVLFVGDDDSDLLSKRLTTPSPLTGEAPFTPAKALAFMVFVLLYFPCIATLAAISRETGSWKYAAFSLAYNTAIAWLLSFVTYRLALLF